MDNSNPFAKHIAVEKEYQRMGFCPDCERPSDFSNICPSCLSAREACGRIAAENNDGRRENE